MKNYAEGLSQIKRVQAHEKGVQFEKRVARWLKQKFGYNCERRVLVRGQIAKRPYEVDIHAWREERVISQFGKPFIDRTDVWVECKTYKVRRSHVSQLLEYARDVEYAADILKIAEWSPDILMLVSNVGFDIDSIRFANEFSIYCVKIGKRRYTFVGEMTREDFNDAELSQF